MLIKEHQANPRFFQICVCHTTLPRPCSLLPFLAATPIQTNALETYICAEATRVRSKYSDVQHDLSVVFISGSSDTQFRSRQSHSWKGCCPDARDTADIANCSGGVQFSTTRRVVFILTHCTRKTVLSQSFSKRRADSSHIQQCAALVPIRACDWTANPGE